MAYRVSMEELGVADDNAVFQGATPGDVWRQVAEHLKKTRGLNLPDVGDAFGDVSPGILPPRFDNAIPGQQSPVLAPLVNPAEGSDKELGVELIVKRLLEKLRMGPQDPGGDVTPPAGKSRVD